MKIKESQIQTAIEQVLRLYENMGKLVYIKNNSGAMQNKQGRFIRFGKRGSSDFILFIKGKTLFIEVKTPTGKQSQSQREFQEMVENQGFEYHLVTGIKRIEELIKQCQ